MTMPPRRLRARRGFALTTAALAGLVSVLAGCGGGDSNPLGNPANVSNPSGTSGQKLSYAYFQRCINPILQAQLQINVGGVVSTNSCVGSGCHNNSTGTGGALRIVPTTQVIDVTAPANTADVIRASDMYKNFYSSQGSTVPGEPGQSRLLTKPLVQGVLHGGGLIFENANDPNVKLIQYWITHPAPQGQDEFGTATYSMFTPADPNTGTCNTQ